MRETEYPTEPEHKYTLSSTESVTEGIISAVSEFSDTSPTPEFTEDGKQGESLEPLYHSIDPDALDALIDRHGTGARESVEVRFQYMGYEITVSGAGVIGITRPRFSVC